LEPLVLKRALVALLALLSGVAVARRRKAVQDERSLWHEATTAPDLR